jgi:hypothetical protein
MQPASTSILQEEARSLVNAHLARVVVHADKLEIEYRADPRDPDLTSALSIPWRKPPTHVRRDVLVPHSSDDDTRSLVAEDRDRLIRTIATARAWLDGLIKGTISGLDELAAMHKRSERSIRQKLSLAFLDPALIDAACAGALPRGNGVTRMMELPPRFADQWRALGLQRR